MKEDAQEYFNLGVKCFKDEKFDQAIENYSKAIN